MYSWEINVDEYKYESIQHGYEFQYDDEPEDDIEVSLEEMLELEDEALEMEEAF